MSQATIIGVTAQQMRDLQMRLGTNATGVFGPITLEAVDAALCELAAATECGEEPGSPPDSFPLPPQGSPGQMSANFTLAEMTHSNTAVSRGIPNKPSATSIANLQVLVDKVLQPLRNRIGSAVRVTSGYRSDAVNRAVGGAASSQHRIGEAADIQVPGMTPFAVAELIRLHLPFDQLILTGQVPGNRNAGFVHVSYRTNRLRRDLLTHQSGVSGYRRGILQL
jgi:hypothetical protein